MFLPLMLTLLAAGPGRPSPALARMGDPPVRVSLSADGRYQPGDRAGVDVRFDEDGYLLVLAMDPDGHVRVLFPLDPGQDAFVRGGHDVELRGRSGRGAFIVADAPGSGSVLAARTVRPMRFDGFVRGDHWDYAALDAAAQSVLASAAPPAQGGSSSAAPAASDPDAVLLGIVQQMAGPEHFDYDVTSYTVAGAAYGGAAYGGPAYGGPYYAYAPWSVTVGYGWGFPYYYYACYDPFFCGPSYYFAAFYFSPFFYRPWRGGPIYLRPYRWLGGGRVFVPVGPGYRPRGDAVRPAPRPVGSPGGRRVAPPAGFRSAPSYRSAPLYRGVAYRSAPVYRSAPAYRSAPVYRSAPAFRGGGGYRGAVSGGGWRGGVGGGAARGGGGGGGGGRRR